MNNKLKIYIVIQKKKLKIITIKIAKYWKIVFYILEKLYF